MKELLQRDVDTEGISLALSEVEGLGRLLSLLRAKLLPDIVALSEEVVRCLRRNGKVMFCGNGGSATLAAHLSAEFVGRFRTERSGYPALALGMNPGILTAVGNDYSYEDVFAREIQSLGKNGDVLIAISTSGNSGNVLSAVDMALRCRVWPFALTGGDGGELVKQVFRSVVIPSENTARVQEAHLLVGHILCGLVESRLGGDLFKPGLD